MIPKVVKVDTLLKLLMKSLNKSIHLKAQRFQQVFCILLKPKYFFVVTVVVLFKTTDYF